MNMGIKMNTFILLTIIYPKINIKFVKKFCLGNNLLMHLKENTELPLQMTWQLPSAETNLKGYIGNTFFRTPKQWYLNQKQIKWQHTSNIFLGLQHPYFWQNKTFTFCWKWQWGQISIKLALSSSAANINSQPIFTWDISSVFNYVYFIWEF